MAAFLGVDFLFMMSVFVLPAAVALNQCHSSSEWSRKKHFKKLKLCVCV